MPSACDLTLVHASLIVLELSNVEDLLIIHEGPNLKGPYSLNTDMVNRSVTGVLAFRRDFQTRLKSGGLPSHCTGTEP